MMHTEDEAKTKWCPFARVIAVTDEFLYMAGNRVKNHQQWPAKTNLNPEAARCIGSACMAFRWQRDATKIIGPGLIVMVDQCDEDLLSGVYWDGRYPKSKRGYLHSRVLERHYGRPDSKLFGDHIDGDALNNRLGNLRWATPSQNAANAASRGGESRYRGVFRARNGKWVAQIAKNGDRRTLGTYETETEAATAYDLAAKDIHGEFARLNLISRENSGRLCYCGLAGRPA